MKKTIILLSVLALVFLSAQAFAQSAYRNNGPSYSVMTPGQMPSYVNPNGGGGYTIMTPGQQPTYVNPSGGGSYTVITPGQMPTYITPNGGNSYGNQRTGIPWTPAPQPYYNRR
jgi:hypothetical protein